MACKVVEVTGHGGRSAGDQLRGTLELARSKVTPPVLPCTVGRRLQRVPGASRTLPPAHPVRA